MPAPRNTSQHYPFGMVMPNRNWAAGSEYSFGFHGIIKEGSQLNVGLYSTYYREFDSRIGRWWSIDPKATQAAWESPYASMSNNSILYTDKYGDEVTITHRKGLLNLFKKETLTYENGQLFNSDGSAYTEKARGFLKKSVNALDELNTVSEGSYILTELENSTNIFNITKGRVNQFVNDDFNKAHANQFSTDPDAAGAYASLQSIGTNFSGGSGGTIYFNPKSLGGFEEGNTRQNRPTLSLGHELAHGLDANRGLLDSRQHQGLNRSEWQATYRENLIRLQMNLPLRTDYFGQQLEDGTIIGGGPNLLDEVGLPTLPSWYHH